MTAKPSPEVLVISASHGENLGLAERFAAAARQQGAEATVLDLTSLDLPLFTSRLQGATAPAALAAGTVADDLLGSPVQAGDSRGDTARKGIRRRDP